MSTAQVFCVLPVERDGVRGRRTSTDGVTKKGDPNNYQDRLKTYKLAPQFWPLKQPSPENLARAGFIYTGQGTRLNCPSCGIFVEDWNDPQVDPERVHYTRSRDCVFLRNCSQKLNISPHYADPSLRLNSFSNWPLKSIVSPSLLVSAGFYYTGEDTKVCCFSCSVLYADWKRSDLPLEIHRQLSPSCKFLIGLGLDASGLCPPDYSSRELRLESFRHWKSDIVKKSDLAEAGLYFVEQPDVVRCYACGVELKDWAPNETAMEKHKTRNPRCPHVLQWRGPLPTSDLQAQKPRAFQAQLQPPEPSRRLSDNTVYIPPSLAGRSYTRSLSDKYPHDVGTWRPKQYVELTSSDDIRVDSPSYRWMLDAGVDIRLPPSLDMIHKAALSSTSRTVEASKSRNTVRPAVAPPTAFIPPILRTSPSPSFLITPPPSSLSTASPPLSPSHTELYNTESSTPAVSGHPVSSTTPSGDDSKLCQICFENPLGMVFIPCGHVCTCESCADKVSNCPLCRRPIEKSFRFYLP